VCDIQSFQKQKKRHPNNMGCGPVSLASHCQEMEHFVVIVITRCCLLLMQRSINFSLEVSAASLFTNSIKISLMLLKVVLKFETVGKKTILTL
jgi:hypothetical protein